MTPGMQRFTTEASIEINAPVSKVWEVITRPDYIRQWDDVPDGFQEPSLVMASVLEWPGSARLTVSVCEPKARLRLDYQHPEWPMPVEGIAYDYELRAMAEGACNLIIRVGDWARAPDGRAQDYHQASIEFVQAALATIRDLAEN